MPIRGWAQDAPSDDSGSESVEVSPEAVETLPARILTNPRQSREASLADVLHARQRIESDLRALQQELGSEQARGREAEIEERIRTLSRERITLDRSFSELASGIDPASIARDETPADLNLGTEVRDLLSPLINELKRATSRPREIDRLRTEIAEQRERLARISKAHEQTAKLRAQVEDVEVRAALDAEEEDWTRRERAARTSLRIAEQKLEQRLTENQSISDAIGNLFQLFFKSRGRNLLLALLATGVFLLGLRRLRAFVASRPGLSARAASFHGRIFSLVYSIFTILGALLVFLLALYFFGDWVLLILVILLLLGVVWTSKQAIPRFWRQTVMLLDMGPVREGERLVYNGLPWRVDSISFYTELTNPALVGGLIRLPIDDLSALRSRPHQEEEPWFPTRPGDIVLLDGKRPAEIEFQSVEAVRLRIPGGNRLVMPAAEFLGQRLERLSDGYCVGLDFGLDYGEQAGITTTICDTLQRGVEERWRGTPWADSLLKLSVDFASAGASSLDLFVRADLDGRQAFEYLAQKRMLARFCVDVCNEQGWVIPFTQLTLHVAGAAESASPSLSSSPSPSPSPDSA